MDDIGYDLGAGAAVGGLAFEFLLPVIWWANDGAGRPLRLLPRLLAATGQAWNHAIS